MEIKDILRNQRIALGYTMKEIAVKVGVSEGTISRWESGDIANMRRDKIAQLANALQISPMIIMGHSDPVPSFRISPLEKEIVIHYRDADPGVQMSVRKLLDVKEPDHLIPIAAHAKQNATPEGIASDLAMMDEKP